MKKPEVDQLLVLLRPYEGDIGPRTEWVANATGWTIDGSNNLHCTNMNGSVASFAANQWIGVKSSSSSSHS